MHAGLRLRQVREKLGLTYRQVERASYELAEKRGSPDFIMHLSRLADIENNDVVPGLHKLYTLATVYHINPIEIFRWFNIPLDESFVDGVSFPPPNTHLAAGPASLKIPLRFDPAFNPSRTEFLSRMVQQWGHFEGVLLSATNRNRYGYIGLDDQRMVPLLRPGSIVLVDPACRQISEGNWTSEYDRPMFFVEVHDGYRCGWFHQEGSTLAMQPHPLSRCKPESWRVPGQAEVVGRVVGVVTRLAVPWQRPIEESREAHGD